LIMIAEAVLLLLLGAAAVMDRRRFRVSNRLIAAGCAAGILLRLLSEGRHAIPSFMAGAALPFLICLPLFALSMIGAGDIKLFMMTGIYLGPKGAVQVMAMACVFGAAEAVYRILRYGIGRERFACFFRYLKTALTGREVQPYMLPQEMKQHAQWLMHFAVHIFLAAAVCCLLRGDLP